MLVLALKDRFKVEVMEALDSMLDGDMTISGVRWSTTTVTALMGSGDNLIMALVVEVVTGENLWRGVVGRTLRPPSELGGPVGRGGPTLVTGKGVGDHRVTLAFHNLFPVVGDMPIGVDPDVGGVVTASVRPTSLAPLKGGVGNG